MTEQQKSLVDLYAAGELTEVLVAELIAAANTDPELKEDMESLKATVELLQNDPAPKYSEESFQRTRLKMMARGAVMQSVTPDPAYWQYHLQMTG
jgi:hypothetical protein